MFNVSDYLKKFIRIDGDSLQERDSIHVALHEICGLDTINFDLKKGILYIKASPVVRSIIHTKKAALIAAIKTNNPAIKISDIR